MLAVVGEKCPVVTAEQVGVATTEALGNPRVLGSSTPYRLN
jgi:hypothetical protein